MGRALIIIQSQSDRDRASSWIARAPAGTRVEFKASKRSLPQNDKMWSMLGDISTQVEYHGVKMDAESWKLVFLDGLKREVRIVPNLDGTGFVNIGSKSSSKLTKDEMSDMIELMNAFGANHGIQFHDAEQAA